MDAKSTFWLSVATILAFAAFGICGALYTEVTNPGAVVNETVVWFDLGGATVVISSCIYLHLLVFRRIKKNGRKVRALYRAKGTCHYYKER